MNHRIQRKRQRRHWRRILKRYHGIEEAKIECHRRFVVVYREDN